MTKIDFYLFNKQIIYRVSNNLYDSYYILFVIGYNYC